MHLQCLSVHPTQGFTFTESPTSRFEQIDQKDICLTLAEAFVNGTIKAKKISLTQHIAQGRYNSIQVLMLAPAEIVDRVGAIVQLPKKVENAGLTDLNTVAWLQVDTNKSDNVGSYFLVRSDTDLLDRVNQFFAPFIEEVKELVFA